MKILRSAQIPFWVSILLVTVLHVLWRGYWFGSSNHAVQIPILKSYLDPALYPGDAMVATRSHFTTFYFLLLAGVSRVFANLEALFFVLHLFTEALGFAAVHRLGRWIHPAAGWVAVALFFSGAASIGGGAGLDAHYHTHEAAAQPLLLWAFVWFLQGRRMLAYAATGIAFNFHALSSGHAALMFGLASLASLRRVGARRTAAELGVFGVFALPCLVWMLWSFAAPVTDAWLEQLYARSHRHSFPGAWNSFVFASYAALLATGAVFWARVVALEGVRQRDRDALWLALAVFALCAAGFVFAEWLPLGPVLRAQLFRSTKWLTALVLAYAGAGLVVSWSGGGRGRAVAIFAGIAVFLAPHEVFLPIALTPLVLAIHFGRALPRWCHLLAGVAPLGLALHPEFDVARDLGLAPARALLRATLLDGHGAVVLAVLVAAPWLWRRRETWTRAAVLAGSLFVVLGLVLPDYYRDLHPPLEERKAWIRLQVWARGNSAPDALFLTPVDEQGFRVYSERSVFAEWKDGTQQYFDVAFSDEWWRRVQRVGGHPPYGALSTEQIDALRRDYGITHAVFAETKSLPYPVVYENEQYRVFDLARGPMDAP